VRVFQAVQGVLLGLADVFEEAAHIGGRQFPGMAFVVEEDEAARPVGEAFAGAVLAEACAGDLTDQVEQARCLRRGC
jgi:hypothetical protein